MPRPGRLNPNWKGGISQFRKEDELLNLPDIKYQVTMKLIARIVKNKVTKCWNWTGGIFKVTGRARLCLGKSFLAARLAYVCFKGTIGDLHVLHTCDNVLCVNPEHLWLGTNVDNSRDMVAKGRGAKGDKNGSRKYPERLMRGDEHCNRIDPTRVQGENNGRATLTEDQVKEIRKRYKPYINNHKPSNQRQLATEFKVSVNIIALIVKRITWRHIP